MNRRYPPFLLIVLLLHLSAVQSFSNSTADKEAQWASKIKQSILKLGKGEEARVVVKLRDKTKITGYVSDATAASFVVTDPKTGESKAVAYASVAQVKGLNLSTGAKIGIGIAVGFVLTALFIYLAVRH
jgi:hypothetical protein